MTLSFIRQRMKTRSFEAFAAAGETVFSNVGGRLKRKPWRYRGFVRDRLDDQNEKSWQYRGLLQTGSNEKTWQYRVRDRLIRKTSKDHWEFLPK